MSNVTLSWPANPASEYVSEYEVEQSVNGGVLWTPLATVTDPTFTITDIAPGIYKWRVRAKNFVGVSPYSEVVTAPPVPTAPDPVTLTVS